MKHKRWTLCIAGAVLAVALTSLTTWQKVRAGDDAAAEVTFEKDVVYGNAGGEALKLDLARPVAAKDKTPCIVFIHGGGWSGGDKSAYDGAIKSVAAKGYVAATINYRLLPKFHYPAQVEDSKCAIRFLRAHADEYKIDPDRIGAIGDSAGGYLVQMLAVTEKDDGLEGDGGSADVSSKVAAVVSWYGPADLAADSIPLVGKAIIKNFLGQPDASRDAIEKASPTHYVHAKEPPILLLQGTADPLVPYSQAIAMSDKLTEKKAAGRCELILNAGHGFQGDDLKHALEASEAFFREHLDGK